MKNILIVEDDVLIAEIEKDYLEASNYNVTIAGDGISGMERALNSTYDLIILDVMLPGMDGFDLCRKIRKESDIPIILITARKEDIDKIRGLGLGANDYMVKPFSPTEMIARVKAHIEHFERLSKKEIREKKEDSKIVVRDITIEPWARRVIVRGQEVDLVNKEFELLVFLAENSDIVFSKETILDRIWGMDAVGSTATVTVHINRIREKIELNSAEPEYIETVWGAGYRMKTT